MVDYTAEFAVVLDDSRAPVILFTGTKAQCKAFMAQNPERCDSYVFIQELSAA